MCPHIVSADSTRKKAEVARDHHDAGAACATASQPYRRATTRATHGRITAHSSTSARRWPGFQRKEPCGSADSELGPHWLGQAQCLHEPLDRRQFTGKAHSRSSLNEGCSERLCTCLKTSTPEPCTCTLHRLDDATDGSSQRQHLWCARAMAPTAAS